MLPLCARIWLLSHLAPTTLIITRIILPVKVNLRFQLGDRILKSDFFTYNLKNFPKSQEMGVSKILYIKVGALQVSNHLTSESEWAPSLFFADLGFMPCQVYG